MKRSLDELLAAKEDEHLEFKEAKNNFHFEKLVKYCAALANEGGGSVVLGVTDKRPRKVVGSQVFENIERAKAGLIDKLRLRIDVEEVAHPDGRVLIFSAPPHPIGVPVAVDGAYWMRAGEDLVPMTPDMLRRIFAEAGPDFSAEVAPGATLDDLDPEAISVFRTRWHRRAKTDTVLHSGVERLLSDAELLTESGITYAALVLLGTPRALGRHLAQAEVVFEYRATDSTGPAGQREEFRKGFLLFYDRLWELVNLRNDRQHYQDGLFMVDISTLNEGAVREAILNAISHRDYRHAGSVFIRQYPRRIESSARAVSRKASPQRTFWTDSSHATVESPMHSLVAVSSNAPGKAPTESSSPASRKERRCRTSLTPMRSRSLWPCTARYRTCGSSDLWSASGERGEPASIRMSS